MEDVKLRKNASHWSVQKTEVPAVLFSFSVHRFSKKIPRMKKIFEYTFASEMVVYAKKKKMFM